MQDQSQGSRVEVYSVTKTQRSCAIIQFLMIHVHDSLNSTNIIYALPCNEVTHKVSRVLPIIDIIELLIHFSFTIQRFSIISYETL